MRQKKKKQKNCHYCSWASFFTEAKWSVYACAYITLGRAHIFKAQKNISSFLKGYYEVSLPNCHQKIERMRETANMQFISNVITKMRP